jgi:hypothetical protein
VNEAQEQVLLRQGKEPEHWAQMSIKIEEWFTYHPPTSDQLGAYNALREAAKQFAYHIIAWTPYCADQTVALRKVREAVMTANAAIACGGK